jgi:hypothetical protein
MVPVSYDLSRATPDMLSACMLGRTRLGCTRASTARFAYFKIVELSLAVLPLCRKELRGPCGHFRPIGSLEAHAKHSCDPRQFNSASLPSPDFVNE